MFLQEYDLQSLQKIKPKGQNFCMFVTPRFVNHYTEIEYEKLTSRLVKAYVKDNSIFVDVGAHYGFFTLLVANECKPEKIFSFEPVPVNYEILLKNIELNQLVNIEARQEAVSDEVGKKLLEISEASDNCGFYGHTNAKTINQIQVDTVILDDILAQFIDKDIFIKIDVEGAELSVLRGMQKIIEKCLPKLRLIVEYNPKLLRRAGFEPVELVKYLFSIGFQVYLIDEQNQIVKTIRSNRPDWNGQLSNIEKQNGYANLLCLPIEEATHVCFFSHSGEMYGSERSLLTIASELISRGVVCSVIVPSKGELSKYLEKIGASVIECPYEWWAYSNEIDSHQSLQKLQANFDLVLKDILPNLLLVNPDVLITNTSVIPWGAILAYLVNRPHVWYLREFGWLDHGLRYIYPEQMMSDLFESSSNLIFTNSVAVKEYFFGKTTDRKIDVVYPFIDLRLTREERESNRWFRHKDSVHLSIVGTVTPSKGQFDALMAIRRLIEMGIKAELVIAGHANFEYLKLLLDYVEQHNLENHVRFVGYQSDPQPIYEQSDIVLVCSRHEAFGRVTLEAMSIGKPVIATASGGTLEIIEDGISGFLYNPNEIDVLVEKILFVINNPQKRDEISHNALQRAKTFQSSNRFDVFFSRLISQKDKKNEAYGTFVRWVVSLLEREVIELRQDIEVLTGEINSTQERVAGLEAQLAEREAALAALRVEVETSRERVAGLEAQLAEREQQNTALSLQKAALQQELDAARHQTESLRQYQQEREQILQNLNSTLLEIYSSTAWKIIQWMWRVRLWLAPKGSWREKAGRTFMGFWRNSISKQFPVIDENLNRITNQPNERRDNKYVISIDKVFTLDNLGVIVFGWWYVDSKSEVKIYIEQKEIKDIYPLPRSDIFMSEIKKEFPDLGEFCGFVFFAPIILENGKVLRIDYYINGQKNIINVKINDELRGVEKVKGIMSMIPSPYRHDFDKYELFDRVLGHPVEKYWQNFLKKRKVHVKEKVFGREVENPKVSLIIPIYGRYDFIRYQLAHFANDGDFADAELIYIVDDPQIVDEVISASVRYHDVFGLPFKIVSFDQNLGYAGANNMGVSYSSADMLLLMNSDIIPQHKGWLSTLYNLISSSENIGAVGPILLFYDGSIQHMGMDVYYEPTLPKYILNSHPNKGMLIDIPPTPYQVKMLSGACVMLRKKDYQNIGGFDEGYIVGDFEDSDLCLRLRALGKEFYVDPRARLFHLERQSQMKGLNHDLRFIITLYNGWRYAEKIRNGKLTHPEAIKL